MSSEIIVKRKQVFDFRKKEFVDEVLPTLTVQKADQIRGAGVTVTAGSHRIGQGSTLLLTELSVQSGSPDFWWIITREGTPFPGEKKGTIKIGYFESKGETRLLGEQMAPVMSIGPGTMRLQMLTPGSAKNFGFSFEGIER